MNKDIYLTNNLSNKKEKFVPLDNKNIGMYVCGPTVYDNPHIGNASVTILGFVLARLGFSSSFGYNPINIFQR